jgi:hypothetical protein
MRPGSGTLVEEQTREERFFKASLSAGDFQRQSGLIQGEYGGLPHSPERRDRRGFRHAPGGHQKGRGGKNHAAGSHRRGGFRGSLKRGEKEWFSLTPRIGPWR